MVTIYMKRVLICGNKLKEQTPHVLTVVLNGKEWRREKLWREIVHI